MHILVNMEAYQRSYDRGVGRYAYEVLKMMVAQYPQHQFSVMLNAHCALESIVESVARIVHRDHVKIWHPICSFEEDKRKILEFHRAQFVKSFNANVLIEFDWMSPQVINLIAGMKTIIVWYDLIPYIFKEQYLSCDIAFDAYMKRVRSLKNIDAICGISNATCNDLSSFFSGFIVPPTNISAGCTSYTGDIASYIQTNRKIILSVGGEDYRKNNEYLIKSFALLPDEVRRDCVLVLIFKCSDDYKKVLIKMAKELGLTKQDILVTGYIEEKYLHGLYQNAYLYVMPSLYEGFGLPLIEAMQYGVPVFGSKTSSIPEVIERAESLFDPYDPKSLSDKILAILGDHALYNELKEHSLQKVQNFTWKKTAEKLMGVVQDVYANRASINIPKKTLAMVAPLPPLETGIADYSLALVRELEYLYDVFVITDQEHIEGLTQSFNVEVRSVSWFKKHYDRLDRVVYQFGNSDFHAHMFSLYQKYPGVIVLHDVFLSNILSHLQHTDGAYENIFWQYLMRSHSHAPCISFDKDEYEKSMNMLTQRYPCSLSLLQHSFGMIVHSEHAKSLMTDMLASSETNMVVRIPLLKNVSKSISELKTSKKSCFYIMSFGIVNPPKLPHILIESFLKSSLCKENVRLVFVGQVETHYQDALLSMVPYAQKHKIEFTGRVSSKVFSELQGQADLVVQLRADSRGETSGVILDALSCGNPVIANRHGSLNEYPDDVVYKIPDVFEVDELSQALETLYENPTLRVSFSDKARLYIQTNHCPYNVALQYMQTIESFYQNNFLDQFKKVGLCLGHHADLSEMLYENQVMTRKKLFIDISELVRIDLGTGIQRVDKKIIQHLFVCKQAKFNVFLCCFDAEIRCYRYAHKFTAQMFGMDCSLHDAPIDFHHQDILFLLDLFYSHDMSLLSTLPVQIYFMQYDLLPITLPKTFPARTESSMRGYLNDLRNIASGCFTISHYTSCALMKYYGKKVPQSFSIKTIPLGYEISKEVCCMPNLENISFFLMVSTLEPRKGHADVLDAFEILWSQGLDKHLVFVGKEDLMVEHLIERIESHPQKGKKLHWLGRVEDDQLAWLYQKCEAFIMASIDEGFGLPIIEAMAYDCPVILRDIEVFREVAGHQGCYFDKSIPVPSLVKVIKEKQYFLGDYNEILEYYTWEHAAEAIMQALAYGEWDKVWCTENKVWYDQSDQKKREVVV